MSTTFSGVSTTTFDHTYKQTLDLESQTGGPKFSRSQAWTNGTGSNQANTVVSDTRSAAGAADVLDLTSTFSDAYGTVAAFSKIKELFIKNNSTTSGYNLTLTGTFMTNLVGNAAHQETVAPGGIFHKRSPIDGFAVANGSTDGLSIDPGANTIEYEIVLVGIV